MDEHRGRRSEVGTVYAVGLFQGLSLVAFPAAATILTSKSGYDLSTSRYGVLFLPQVALAISGSLALPRMGRRFDLKPLLIVGVGADIVSMVLLVASNAYQTSAAAYPTLLVATGFLGLGFGVTLSVISTYAGSFFPDRRDMALTGLNVLLGLGTALSPLLIGIFVDLAKWWYLPLVVAVGLVALLGLSLAQPLAVEAGGGRSSGHEAVPLTFWLFAAAVLLYGVGETMFGNWGTTLLKNAGVARTSANYALAAFWAAVTAGRLFVAVSSGRVRSTYIYVVLPWAMAAALVVSSYASSAAAGILLFAFGGLACSGFFPMSIAYGETTFPRLVELAAGWLVASYQVGYGIAAFGGGALQKAVSLPAVFRIVAVLAVAMAVLSVLIARRQVDPARAETGSGVAPARA